MILYLHGFRSSPQSMKARLTGERMAQLGRSDEFLCPQLPASPKLAMELAMALVADVPPAELTIIGSSLGGFYATWMAEQLKCRAVVLNPAVVAALDLEQHVGVTTAYHSDEPFVFHYGHRADVLAHVFPRHHEKRENQLARTQLGFTNQRTQGRSPPQAAATIFRKCRHSDQCCASKNQLHD